MTPTVSVVMPVYNGQAYLRPAIESVLGQTFDDFEFIIVDDGSADRTFEIAMSYDDSRIRVVRMPSNVGLPDALNRGLDLAAGRYIARMDGDDISMPERFAKQVAYMDEHPTVGVCGTWARDIDQSGRVVADRPRRLGSQLDCYYWIPSPVIHPSVMMRADLAKRLRYDRTVGAYVEDFDLWLRVVETGYRLHNLDEYLLLYRVHAASVSFAIIEEQLCRAYWSVCRHFSSLRITYDEYRQFFMGSYDINPVRRAAILGSMARRIPGPCWAFVEDSLHYTRMWLQITSYNRVSTLPGFLTMRKIKRQLATRLFARHRPGQAR